MDYSCRTLCAVIASGLVGFLSVAPAVADDYQDLHFQWVGMIDNYEGSMGGDVANFHYEVYAGGSNKPIVHGILYGPSRKPQYSKNYEWGDEQELSYPAFMIHRWQPGESSVRLKIWESDEGWGDDLVLDIEIPRDRTMGQGMLLYGEQTKMTQRPAWLAKLPSGIPRDRKAYFQLVTRTLSPGSTYKWVLVGYGDIPRNDAPPHSPRANGGPQPSRAASSTVGLGAVCPWDDASKCHYKTVSALEVIGGRGDHPGEVYECIPPSHAPVYRWKSIGEGDIAYHDVGSGPVVNGAPDPTRCNPNSVGRGAVIPYDNSAQVFYKDVAAEEMLVKDQNGHYRGKHPGRVFKCVCESR